MKKRSDLNLCFIGLGLMGGALAMGLRKIGFNKIVAYDIDQEVIHQALADGVIDGGTWVSLELQDFLSQSDFVYLCISPKDALAFMALYMEDFKPGALVTDISGVKEIIFKNLGKLLRTDIDFIPGHPMAGSEKEGYHHADDSIFKDRNYILTPLATNDPVNIEFLKAVIYDLGFNHIVETTCAIHDEKIAFTSQLCHVIASALVDCEDDLGITDFEGGSFGDLTRIAMINAPMWSELFTANRKNLIAQIEKFESSLTALKILIDDDQDDLLIERLKLVREKRIAMGHIREKKIKRVEKKI